MHAPMLAADPRPDRCRLCGALVHRAATPGGSLTVERTGTRPDGSPVYGLHQHW